MNAPDKKNAPPCRFFLHLLVFGPSINVQWRKLSIHPFSKFVPCLKNNVQHRNSEANLHSQTTGDETNNRRCSYSANNNKTTTLLYLCVNYNDGVVIVVKYFIYNTRSTIFNTTTLTLLKIIIILLFSVLLFCSIIIRFKITF